MNLFTTALLAITIFAACTTATTPEKNTETPAAADNWTDLLADSNKARWHNYNKPGTVGAAWKMENGILRLDTTNKKDGKITDGGNLVYDEVLENFHLQLEWKIAPGGNSGIMFLVQEDSTFGEPYFTGPEMQVLDNALHPDGKITKHRAGDLYDLISCSTETVKQAGEWNLAEIIVDNAQLTFKLNGTEVVHTTLWDSTWNAMVAASKFKAWPAFGTFRSGKIVLQDHDNEVSYRNIRLKKW